jgi:hypothetical protein
VAPFPEGGADTVSKTDDPGWREVDGTLKWDGRAPGVGARTVGVGTGSPEAVSLTNCEYYKVEVLCYSLVFDSRKQYCV